MLQEHALQAIQVHHALQVVNPARQKFIVFGNCWCFLLHLSTQAKTNEASLSEYHPHAPARRASQSPAFCQNYCCLKATSTVFYNGQSIVAQKYPPTMHRMIFSYLIRPLSFQRVETIADDRDRSTSKDLLRGTIYLTVRSYHEVSRRHLCGGF